MEIIPNIIDTEFLRFKELGDEPLLGFIGRLTEGKGLEEAVRIAHSTGYRLRVLGEGKAVKGAKALAKELGYKDEVDFAGKVPYETVPDEYHRMSLLVAPFQRIEPLARVPLEANSCGRGAITTTIAGGSERMKDGYNGYVFEPEDLEGMTRTVKEVMEDRELLGSLGRNGRKFVESYHHPDVILKKVERFYERIIERKRRG
jgi:glycosyltransferase involved in cell wall biosynthesis